MYTERVGRTWISLAKRGATSEPFELAWRPAFGADKSRRDGGADREFGSPGVAKRPKSIQGVYPDAPGALNGRPRPSIGHPRGVLGSQNLDV